MADDDETGSTMITRTDVHLIISIFLGSLIAVQAWDLTTVMDDPRVDQLIKDMAEPWATAPTGAESTAEIASTLFADWAFPFEVLSLLLLVALVGALAIAMRPDHGGER